MAPRAYVWSPFLSLVIVRLRTRIALATALVVVVAGIVAAAFVATELEEIARGEAPAPGATEYLELATVLLPFALLTPIVSWLAAGWSLRPLRRAADEARNIGPTDSTRRLSTQALPGEVRPLVEAVNGALDRLTAACERERQLSADTAHALRNPVAVLGLRIQHLRDDGEIDVMALESDITRIGRAIEQLLLLAGLGREEPATQLATVSLGRAVRAAVTGLLPLADSAARTIVVDADAPATIVAVEALIEEAVATIIDNAIVHGGGTIRVAVRVLGNEGCVVVDDDGPGVPESMRVAMRARFGKGAESSGTGLGLAITGAICERFGGELRWPAPARFELAFPLASSALSVRSDAMEPSAQA